jgi:hypothetical protein
MEVRAAVQQVALEHRRRYGYRRVTAELRRRGLAANHKRVARLTTLWVNECLTLGVHSNLMSCVTSANFGSPCGFVSCCKVKSC